MTRKNRKVLLAILAVVIAWLAISVVRDPEGAQRRFHEGFDKVSGN